MKKNSMRLIVLMIAVTLFAGCSSNTTSKTADNQADTDGDTLPNTVEKTYGTNPYASDTDGDKISDAEDEQPNFAQMPFDMDGNPMTVEIIDARVEDNKTEDHLEMTLKNTGTSGLDQLDIYYTIEDKVDGITEAYYQKLTGLSVAPGEESTIHFDNLQEPNHYKGNMNGLYGTSENGPTFTITLHNAQNEFIMFTVVKDTGAAEVAD